MGHVPRMHGIDAKPAMAKHAAMASGMMGLTAEYLRTMHAITREDQDAFDMWSHQRALQARLNGGFKDETEPLAGYDKDGMMTMVDYDEMVRPETNMECPAALRP